MFRRLVLSADQLSRMHADLQGMFLAPVAALTVYNSSKSSSLVKVGLTSAYFQRSCRNSGMKSSTCTLATLSSGLAASARCGGHVINVQMAFLISGRLLYGIGHMGPAVLSAQAGPFVSITRLPDGHRQLRCCGMPKRITHYLQPK